jgi:hypothetical protein
LSRGTAPGPSLRLFLVAASTLIGPQGASAAETESASLSLKGLRSFRVVVEQLGSQVENSATAKRQDLQADVEARLAQAGIRVSKDASAILYVNVAVVCHGASCALNVTLEVQQRVRLEQRPQAEALIVPTWRTGITGLIGRQPDLIRKNLRDQVDQFVTAYRSANPAK